MKQRDSKWAVLKGILGFTFYGDRKTLWLEEGKMDNLLIQLKSWMRGSDQKQARVELDKFEPTLSKLRHAFTAILAGKGLLSPMNTVL